MGAAEDLVVRGFSAAVVIGLLEGELGVPRAAIDPRKTELVSDLFTEVVARVAAVLEHEVVVVCSARQVSQPHSALSDNTGI